MVEKNNEYICSRTYKRTPSVDKGHANRDANIYRKKQRKMIGWLVDRHTSSDWTFLRSVLSQLSIAAPNRERSLIGRQLAVERRIKRQLNGPKIACFDKLPARSPSTACNTVCDASSFNTSPRRADSKITHAVEALELSRKRHACSLRRCS